MGWIRKSILSKLMLGTIAMLVIPFFIANMGLYQINYKESLKNAQNSNSELLDVGKESIEDYYRNILSVPLVIYEDNAFCDILQSVGNYSEQELYEIRLQLNQMIQTEETIVKMTVQGLNRESVTQEKVKEDKNLNKNRLYFQKTYYDIPQNDYIAKIEMECSTTNLEKIADQLTKNDNMDSIIILQNIEDESIEYATIPINSMKFKQGNYCQIGELNDEQGFFFTKECSVGDKSLRLVKYIPKSQLLHSLYTFLLEMLLVQFALLICCLVFVYFIYRNMILPIRNIAENIDKVQEGKYEYHAAYRTKDEIGTLDIKYEEMVVTINNLINKDLKNALEVSKARLKMLQAQINPHFMNNILQSISTMALKEGAYQTSGYLGKLGRMFQYNMDTSTEIVSVEEELKHIQNYLALQKNRFRDKLEYSVYAEDEVKEMRMPKMILQPLVENCISHGRNIKNDNLKIRVCIAWDDQLIVSVYDNGGNFEAEKLNKMKEKFENYKIEPEAGHGIGFLNVLYRLDLYAKNFSWEVQSEETKGTIITLKMDIGE